DAEDGPFSDDDLRTAIVDASAISAGYEAVIASVGRGGAIRVVTVAPRTVPRAARSFRAPAPSLVSLAIAPSGGTLAVVAGPLQTGASPPQDLFTIRIGDGVTTRRTETGDVADAAFVDDDHVV